MQTDVLGIDLETVPVSVLAGDMSSRQLVIAFVAGWDTQRPGEPLPKSRDIASGLGIDEVLVSTALTYLKRNPTAPPGGRKLTYSRTKRVYKREHT